MVIEHSTASASAKIAVAHARRALNATAAFHPSESLFAALSIYRAVGALGDVYGLSEEKSAALLNERDKVCGLIQRAEIKSRWDAVAKLELVAESFDIGERYDGKDEAMLRDVIAWLRAGGMH